MVLLMFDKINPIVRGLEWHPLLVSRIKGPFQINILLLTGLEKLTVFLCHKNQNCGWSLLHIY